MGEHDDYARKEAARRRAYRAAYQSAEAQEWIASLPPGKREQAEQRGLLRPLEDRDCYERSIEELPAHLEPRQDAGIGGAKPALPFRRAAPAYAGDTGWAELLQQTENKAARLFQAFLSQNGTPQLRWACIRYLTGEGTCESHARGLGISRQAFHYHVRKLSRQLGLPPLGKPERALFAFYSFPIQYIMKTKTAASPQHQSRCRVSTTSRRTRRLVPASIGNVLITGKGLILTEKRSSPPEYNHLFRTILSFYQSSCWLLGDILLLGDRQWGNRHTASKYEEAMQATGLSRIRPPPLPPPPGQMPLNCWDCRNGLTPPPRPSGMPSSLQLGLRSRSPPPTPLNNAGKRST